MRLAAARFTLISPSTASIIPSQRAERRILLIRGQRVILNSDLAELYDVTTKRLNEQVRRNIGRFPCDFMLQPTEPGGLRGQGLDYGMETVAAPSVYLRASISARLTEPFPGTSDKHSIRD